MFSADTRWTTLYCSRQRQSVALDAFENKMTRYDRKRYLNPNNKVDMHFREVYDGTCNACCFRCLNFAHVKYGTKRRSRLFHLINGSDLELLKRTVLHSICKTKGDLHYFRTL